MIKAYDYKQLLALATETLYEEGMYDSIDVTFYDQDDIDLGYLRVYDDRKHCLRLEKVSRDEILDNEFTVIDKYENDIIVRVLW